MGRWIALASGLSLSLAVWGQSAPRWADLMVWERAQDPKCWLSVIEWWVRKRWLGVQDVWQVLWNYQGKMANSQYHLSWCMPSLAAGILFRVLYLFCVEPGVFWEAVPHCLIVTSLSAAGNAFCQAAKLHMQLQSKHDSATSFVDAGNAYKKADPQGKATYLCL